ncbi:MAG TPA: PEP-CTERM sorting domain-containing protein [Phycisphaerales bacterium]|nr:PEP-CTERM sorting domain-containing protein [Phycisphaerales bacterium]
MASWYSGGGLAGLVGALAIGATAVAQPGAEPIGGPSQALDSNATCLWSSTIHPALGAAPQSCLELMNGLNAQNFNAAGGWNVNFGGVLSPGAIQVDLYYAWVTNEPTVTCGGQNFPGTATGQIGGTVLCLSYTPGAGDPAGNDVHWIQGISTNCPSQFGIDNGVAQPGGFTHYLDNGLNGAPGVDPFYDTNGAADSNFFLDIPFRSCGSDCDEFCVWDACVFLATGNVATQTLTVYATGISWGFSFLCTPVPAPGATALLALGGLVAFRRRR